MDFGKGIIKKFKKFFNTVTGCAFFIAALTIIVFVFAAGIANLSQYSGSGNKPGDKTSSAASSEGSSVLSEEVSSEPDESSEASSEAVSSEEEKIPNVEKLVPSKTSISVYEGKSVKVTLSALPEKSVPCEIKWSSTNTSVATVKDGIVYGEKEGECTVKAILVSNPEISCSVSVVVKKAVTLDYKMVVYLGSQSIGVYKKDASGDYTQLVKVLTCSTGTSSNPTPPGTYKILRKARWKELMGPSWGQYTSSISSSYLFHSEPYNKRNDPSTMTMNGYRKLGKRASHGCIRLACIDSKWIYDNMPIGTTVQIVSKSGPKGPAPVPLKSGSKYYGWDPTDPNPDNPYNKPEPTTTTKPTTTTTTVKPTTTTPKPTTTATTQKPTTTTTTPKPTTTTPKPTTTTTVTTPKPTEPVTSE